MLCILIRSALARRFYWVPWTYVSRGKEYQQILVGKKNVYLALLAWLPKGRNYTDKWLVKLPQACWKCSSGTAGGIQFHGRITVSQNLCANPSGPRIAIWCGRMGTAQLIKSQNKRGNKSCSKLTMSLVNVSLKLWSLNMAKALIFLLKKICEKLLHLQKLLTFFSAKIPVD